MSVSVPTMSRMPMTGSMTGSMAGSMAGSMGPLTSLLGYDAGLMVGASTTSPRASPQASPRTSPHHGGWSCPPLQVKQEPISERDHDSSATSATSGISSMAQSSFLSGTNTSPSSSSSAGSPPAYHQHHHHHQQQQQQQQAPHSPSPPHSTPSSATAPSAPVVNTPVHTPGPPSSPPQGVGVGPVVGKVPRTPGSLDDNSRSSTCSYSEDDAEEQVRRLRATIESASSLQCQLCNFTADTRERLADHVASHYKCSLCDFAASSPDSMRVHLQEAHDYLPQLSPEPNPCDNGYLEDADEGVATPRVNSQGKVKTFRCKQCEFVAVTKLDFWEHTKLHIKQEKLLCCPKCPFVTEYKHHLEYHLRNHFNSKPFKCDKCSYSCVNKSMLNSHLKSHSNVYQYRCADCTYATKYCHSLKLHLRKYGHHPSMVLNPDGTPNPLPIIDVYGTRRGPKTKTSKAAQAAQAALMQQQQQQQQQYGMFPAPYGLSPIFPYATPPPAAQDQPLLGPGGPNATANARQGGSPNRCSYCDFTTSEADVLAQHMFVHAENNLIQYFQANNNNYYQDGVKDFMSKMPPQPSPPGPAAAPAAAPAAPQPPAQPGSPPRTPSSPSTPRSGAVPSAGPGGRPSGGAPLDLSKPEASEEVRDARDPRDAPKNRRKGRAFKLERIAIRLQDDDAEAEQLVAKVPRIDGAAPGTAPWPLTAPGAAPAPGRALMPSLSPDLKPTARSPSPPTSPPTAPSAAQNATPNAAPRKEEYNCTYCDIAFRDIVMYTMHMGYHGYQDPFQCNMCGQQTSDKVAFFLHIARSSHS